MVARRLRDLAIFDQRWKEYEPPEEEEEEEDDDEDNQDDAAGTDSSAQDQVIFIKKIFT